MPVITDGLLTFVQKNLQPLVQKFKPPFTITDGPEIRERVRRLNDSFRAVGLDFMELFALKADPRIEIFKGFIGSEGCGSMTSPVSRRFLIHFLALSASASIRARFFCQGKSMVRLNSARKVPNLAFPSLNSWTRVNLQSRRVAPKKSGFTP